MSEEVNEAQEFVVNEAPAQEEAQPESEPGANDVLIIEEGVVEKIAAVTMESVDGILEIGSKGNILQMIQKGITGSGKNGGISATIDDAGKVAVSVSIIMEYGKKAPEIFADIRKTCGGAIEEMTGLTVDQIKLRVIDVMTREEFDAKRKAAEEKAEEEEVVTEVEVVE